jgi:hypothetical protein
MLPYTAPRQRAEIASMWHEVALSRLAVPTEKSIWHAQHGLNGVDHRLALSRAPTKNSNRIVRSPDGVVKVANTPLQNLEREVCRLCGRSKPALDAQLPDYGRVVQVRWR